MLIEALFAIAKLRQQAKCPVADERIKKTCSAHTNPHTEEYYLATKRNDTFLFGMTQLDLEAIMLSEVSKTEKDKYHKISPSYGI